MLTYGCTKPEEDDPSSYVETIEYETATIQVGTSYGYNSHIITYDGEYLIAESYHTYNGDFETFIASVGKVEGLSAINTIPANFYTEAACVAGNGYVTRVNKTGSNYFTYCRLFVTEIVKDADGNPLAVKLRYANFSL